MTDSTPPRASRPDGPPPRMSLDTALFSTISQRRLKPDPVPLADLQYIVEAATMGPSAGNTQDWGWVVIQDPAVRRAIGDFHRAIAQEMIGDRFLSDADLPEEQRRMYEAVMGLALSMDAAPAVIAVGVPGGPPNDAWAASWYYGSIYPAIQNLTLAARGRGLGTTLSSIHRPHQDRLRPILGVPDDLDIVMLIPVGYPEDPWRRPRRRPAPEVTHWDRWGNHDPPHAPA